MEGGRSWKLCMLFFGKEVQPFPPLRADPGFLFSPSYKRSDGHLLSFLYYVLSSFVLLCQGL